MSLCHGLLADDQVILGRYHVLIAQPNVRLGRSPHANGSFGSKAVTAGLGVMRTFSSQEIGNAAAGRR